MALTALKVKNAKPGRHVDGRGLCLLVKPSGARTWVLRMQKDGRRRDYGLGSALDVSLAEARDAASALRRRVREGVDPVAERRKSRKVVPSLGNWLRGTPMMPWRLASKCTAPKQAI